MTQERFNKATLRKALDVRLRHYEDTYGFDQANGWAQVDGEMNRRYGKYAAALELYELFDLYDQ